MAVKSVSHYDGITRICDEYSLLIGERHGQPQSILWRTNSAAGKKLVKTVEIEESKHENDVNAVPALAFIAFVSSTAALLLARYLWGRRSDRPGKQEPQETQQLALPVVVEPPEEAPQLRGETTDVACGPDHQESVESASGTSAVKQELDPPIQELEDNATAQSLDKPKREEIPINIQVKCEWVCGSWCIPPNVNFHWDRDDLCGFRLEFAIVRSDVVPPKMSPGVGVQSVPSLLITFQSLPLPVSATLVCNLLSFEDRLRIVESNLASAEETAKNWSLKIEKTETDIKELQKQKLAATSFFGPEQAFCSGQNNPGSCQSVVKCPPRLEFVNLCRGRSLHLPPMRDPFSHQVPHFASPTACVHKWVERLVSDAKSKVPPAETDPATVGDGLIPMFRRENYLAIKTLSDLIAETKKQVRFEYIMTELVVTRHSFDTTLREITRRFELTPQAIEDDLVRSIGTQSELRASRTSTAEEPQRDETEGREEESRRTPGKLKTVTILLPNPEQPVASELRARETYLGREIEDFVSGLVDMPSVRAPVHQKPRRVLHRSAYSHRRVHEEAEGQRSAVGNHSANRYRHVASRYLQPKGLATEEPACSALHPSSAGSQAASLDGPFRVISSRSPLPRLPALATSSRYK
ncbi:hypothetical protein AAG570_012244 [Ranatra chinensis]|uniref:Uncharacterized protein n=1 Tax=Ranatra chinensis TaxID=642074 RepID=A0ABD0YI82_9HEMI